MAKVEYLSATQAAAMLEPPISVSRMSQLIKADRVKAEKIGRQWFIHPKDLKTLQNRKAGWPLGKSRKISVDNKV